MKLRLKSIKDFPSLRNSNHIAKICLTISESRLVYSWPDEMENLNFVIEKLEEDTTTLTDVHGASDSLIDNHLETAVGLSSPAPIVYYHIFETAVVTIQKMFSILMAKEQALAIILKSQSAICFLFQSSRLSFADKAVFDSLRCVIYESTHKSTYSLLFRHLTSASYTF